MTSTATHPADAVRVEVVQARHGEVEPDADRRGGHRDHRAGQEAEHHAVGEVVDRDELAAADLLELEVERQARAHGDGRRQEHPAQHGQQVARRSRPPTTSKALTPEAMNSGPIISSVPAVCSPAYWPTKLEKPSQARSGTGSRSYSSTGSSCVRRWCRQPCVCPIVRRGAGGGAGAGHEADRSEQPGGNRLHLVHVLRLEPRAVAQVQQLVVGQRVAGHVVDGEVRHVDPDAVRAGPQQRRHVERVRRAPDGSGALAVDRTPRPPRAPGASSQAWTRAPGPPTSMALACAEVERTVRPRRSIAAGTSTVFS